MPTSCLSVFGHFVGGWCLKGELTKNGKYRQLNKVHYISAVRICKYISINAKALMLVKRVLFDSVSTCIIFIPAFFSVSLLLNRFHTLFWCFDC